VNLNIAKRTAWRVALLIFLTTFVDAQEHVPLRLVQTIPIPSIKGRIDHMDVDAAGQRLFVAGLENGSLEVIDLKAGTWSRSIPGFRKPQGVQYVASLNKLFVASGDDGMLRIFRGDTLELLKALPLEKGANRMAYAPRPALLYVGYGGKDAGKDYGEVGIVDPKKGELVGEIQVSAHPAELLLNKSGERLFCFVPVKNQIQVIDTKKKTVVAAWPVRSQKPGDGAYDASTARLFLGTHIPAEMIAMDAQTGKEVAELPTVDGMDGVYFDAKRKRVYVSGGRGLDNGYVYVYQQQGADQYRLAAKVATRPGAGTSLWAPGLNRYYVGAPGNAEATAAILVFAPVE
jgi:DNA-binding beta-propeller fold protein YncE